MEKKQYLAYLVRALVAHMAQFATLSAFGLFFLLDTIRLCMSALATIITDNR